MNLDGLICSKCGCNNGITQYEGKICRNCGMIIVPKQRNFEAKKAMKEKVWKEYCEDCGCPLDICCKSKVPVVELAKLERFCKRKRIWSPSLEKWARNQSGEK